MKFPEIYKQYMYSYPHKTAYHPLHGIDLADYLQRAAKKPLSLYVHIPFCETKCGYCNLFSITGADETLTEQYLEAIRRQVLQYRDLSPSLSFDSLTLGGGTPLFLSETQLETLFEIISLFDAKKSFPVQAETSPRQTTKEKLELLKEYNTKRISIGIQSFHDSELAALGRKHSVLECHKALSLIRDTGFACTNIDLIYGIPNQDISSLRFSIDTALSYEPEELFLYPLYIRPETGLYHKTASSQEETYRLYCFLSPYLKEHGYTQISMRRFVKKKQMSSCSFLEQTSCGFENFLALGCGGRSYLENLHFCTPYHVNSADCRKELTSFLSMDYRLVTHGYLLSDDEMMCRYVIKNLLHKDGISLTDYYEKSTSFNDCLPNGKNLENKKDALFHDFPILSDLLSDGLIQKTEDRIFLTEQGMSLSDAIGPLFISKKKMSVTRSMKYRGILNSCNYSCHYCPFSKKPFSKKQEALDRMALSRLSSYLEQEKEDFTFQIIPYGEACIYAYYWEFLAKVSQNPHAKAVGCQTNVSFPVEQMITLFCQNGDIKKLRLWCTFHPSMVSVEDFCQRIKQLREYGILLCVGAVADPSQKEAILALRLRLPKDIYFWLNRMEGRKHPYSPQERTFFEQIDPLFFLEESHFYANPTQCRAGIFNDGTMGNIFVKADGSIYACPLSNVCLGNLYEKPNVTQKQEHALSSCVKKCNRKECSCFLAYQNHPAALSHLRCLSPYPEFRIKEES